MESTGRCPSDSVECGTDVDPNYCSGHGQCCIHPNANVPNCACDEGYLGTYCETKLQEMFEHSKEMQKTAQAIAAFSAVLGVVVITLFVALIFLQIKYYRRRKKLHLKDGNHELIMISRPDGGENGKGSKKRLTIQPGYSWRESVRPSHFKASQKFRSTLSRSVPEDLFRVGLNLAIVGELNPNHGPIDQQSVTMKAEGKAKTTQRCFSAGPDLGDSSRQTSFDLKDPTGANDRPKVVQMPLTPTEDTVK